VTSEFALLQSRILRFIKFLVSVEQSENMRSGPYHTLSGEF
jgi:hypothetical protein